MDHLYIKIDAAPYIVPMAVVVLGLLLSRLHRRAALTVPRVLVAAVVCVYVCGILANSLFPMFITDYGDSQPWWAGINVTPLANTDAEDMLENVVVFMPVGFFLPLITRVASVRGVLFHAFVISLGLEVLQWLQGLVLDGGHVADINDLAANTLGAPIGYVVFRTALLLPVFRRLATAATWPASRSGDARTRSAQEVQGAGRP